ncbi:MAG: glycosyltransferase family 4 protein [Nitrososphaerota archaeon]|nr:glycosyltransferase family 4 protein [Nitrososphaerota archaeon]
MKALESKGTEVILITPNWSKSESSDSEIYVNPLMLPGLKTTSFMLRANRIIKRLARDFDLVHYTNDYCGFGLSRSEIGKPVLATIHHTHSLESKSIGQHLGQGTIRSLKFRISEAFSGRMEKDMLKKADRVVAVSQFTAENALVLYPFLGDKVKVALNAVDETRFNPRNDPSSLRERFALQSSPTVLYVGRLFAGKGVKFLIDAFKEVESKIPDSKLLIVGSSSDEEGMEIKSQIRRLGLESSVVFAGRVSEEDLPKAYTVSDLVVLPSLVEGFGLVLLEGMASGKPVVATRLGPTEEIVTDGLEGLLTPRADSHSLAEAISSILSDKSLASRMGQAGRRKVEERFSLERWSTEMLEIYRDVISQG